MTKACSKCREEKPLEAFDRNKNLRLGRDSSCKECRRKVKQESLMRLKESDPNEWQERQRRYKDTYKEKHPDRVREQERRRNLMYKFKMTIEQYDGLLSAQGGVCAVCEEPPGERRLAVDHDRACCPTDVTCGGCVRKLLCSNCNMALGLLRDNMEFIDRIRQYVEAHK